MSQPILAVGGVVLSVIEGRPAVCLIRRSQPPLQGAWSLPGGRVEFGEGLQNALRREIQEETGLLVRVGPLLEVVEIIGEGRHHCVLDYLCALEPGSSPSAVRAGDDAQSACFAYLDELEAYELTQAVLRVVDKATGLLKCDDGEA